MKAYNLHEIMSNAWAMYRKWVAPYKYNHSRIPSCYTFASALKQAWAAAKTAANKAILQRENYLLDMKDKQTTLYSTVENYWLQAVTNQNKFKAAKVSTESAQTSYDLLSEQFRLGLKNIVELMTGKDNLLKAQQNELQSKYLAILNLHMLNFYKSGELK